jgi:poly(3-hydroxybutyrate) depolymerase
MNLNKVKYRLRCFAMAIIGSVCLSTLADPMLLTLEEPREGGTYTGISNLRGWAIAESGIDKIELDIDGVYAFDIPMGGSRGDVASAYPDFPNAEQSGFSMAFNYKALAVGVHQVTAPALSKDGAIAVRQVQFTVDRFVSSFITDPDEVDISAVSDVTLTKSALQLKGLRVEGQAFDVALSFDTATQGFELTEITPQESPTAGAGCPSASRTAGEYTLNSQGVERAFRVHTPTGYASDTLYPLIIAFHGWGGDTGEFLDNAVVRSESDQRGYIVVAPLGLGQEEPGNHLASWSFSGSTTGLDGDGLNALVPNDSSAICDDTVTADYRYPSCQDTAENSCSWTQCTTDDFQFTADLVADIQQHYCVDTDRIYALGGSNGGMFVWDLAREESSLGIFAAMASLIGLPHRGYLSPPMATEEIPVMSITGLRDRTVPPGDWGEASFTTTTDGDRYYYTGATAITKAWAEAYGCDTSSAAAPIDVGVSDVDCRGWSFCRGETQWPAVLDCRRDMGHAYGLSWSWPLILDFFDQHSR